MSRYLFTILFIAATVVVLVGTLSPSEVIANAPLINWDKILHFFAIGGWSTSFYLFALERKIHVQKRTLLSISYGIIFGILIEILQYTLPINRSAEFGDVIANSLGAVTLVLVTDFAYRRILSK